MRIRSFVVVGTCLSPLPAQAPVLAPTTHVTISTAGSLHYSSIHIPAGVSVTFDGNAPAIVQCDGDAIVDGSILVFAGAVSTGMGSAGMSCPGSSGGYNASDAVHAGFYGSQMPFDVAGGSHGGSVHTYMHQFFPFVQCGVWTGSIPGAPGGGTLVLVAGGRIEVRGSVSALGVFGWFVGTVRTGSGSGGSILLVGQQGVDVLATGSIDARGGTMGAMHEGYVRLDSYSRPPTVLGSVFPAPMLVELPHLRAPQPPTPGGQWTIEARGPRGDAVVLALGSTPIAPVATPYGVLAIDPGTVAMLGVASVPNQLVDPMGSLGVPIPPLPALVGVVLHVQGVDVLANGSPRLSNLLVATIQ